MTHPALLQTELDGIPVKKGKVRDVYDFGDRLLIVATDRISAFDWILPTGIPDKGRVLTQLSAFWFRRLGVEHHLISTEPTDLPLPAGTDLAAFIGRSMVVKKTKVIPIECVARGYLAGSAWKEYQASRTVCSLSLPDGLQNAQKLSQPLFTPATKAESGHDENIPYAAVCDIIGDDLAERLRDSTLAIYNTGAEFAASRGLILADTKFEFGQISDGKLLLIDEVLTPDSSRYWPASEYRIGRNPPSFDKQFVRDWLEQSGWDKNSPPPPLPTVVVEKTREKYLEAFERLTGQAFAMH